jgi:hypothetical protein
MTVQVTVNQNALRRIVRSRGSTARRKLSERTERVADIAKREAPGHMGDFIDWRVVEDSRGLHGVVTCDHPATRFVLDGTRPHRIPKRPRPGKYLRFEIGGEVLFRKSVWHPGTRANNFLARALRLGR